MEIPMNAIVPFTFEDQPVRVLDQGGEPWFVLADLCRVLDLSNPTKAAAGLDDDEKRTLTNAEGIAPANVQSLVVVSESGMWSLVLRSRKEQAKGLRRFITAKVLPSIRRTGSYGVTAPALDLRDPAVLHRLLLDHTGNALAAEARVAELEPQAEALARLAQTDGELCITDAAKALDVPPRRLFAWLEAHGWTYRRGDGGHWVAYEGKRASGMLKHKSTTITRRGMPDKLVEQVMVTSKGLTRLATLKAGR
jgi:prophage antirepressor-like protein